MTGPPIELSAIERDTRMGRVALPILLAMAYGIYNFINLGAATEHYLYTYTPLFGGAVAIGGLFAYGFAVLDEKIRRSRLWAFAGFFPYLFSLYVIGFLGVFIIYESLVGVFSFWSIVAGLLWIFVGYRMLSQFYLITEIVRRHDEAR